MVKRYEIMGDYEGGMCMEVDLTGEFVYYEDYEKLEAKLKRWLDRNKNLAEELSTLKRAYNRRGERNQPFILRKAQIQFGKFLGAD